MGIVDRARNILVTPKTEWPVIAVESTTPQALVTGYVLPLAAIAAVMAFIKMSLIGTGFMGVTVRTGIGMGLAFAIYQLIMAVVMVFVLAFIVDALAPTFGGQKNFNQALKLVAYSYTAAWVASVFGLIPWIGWLLGLLVSLYSIYLLYLGLPVLMKNPPDKSVVYTVVVIVVAILVMWVIAVIGAMFGGMGMMGAGMSDSGSSVTIREGSAAAKMNDFAKKMEEAGRKMEAAEKSGDPKKQAEAAMATLGTALSGGKGVDPLQLDQLKPFLPDKFAGMPRTDFRTERSGVAGLMTAKAEALYGDSSGKNARLEVVDTGGVAGLMGLTAWASFGGEKEDGNRREVTRKEGNRMVHEEVDKRGGDNKYTVVLADRYVVSAQGSVEINTLKSAVNGLELGKLESLK